ncbi:MAG: sterol-binding protein, partial [Candidatus Parvarchaeum sp.]|nr:sterol-binding protein [Candidatus Parvarchaeum tengchongense]
MEFLSEEWIKAYQSLWNNTKELVDGLKGFKASIKYFIDGSSKPPVMLKVEDGKAVDSGIAKDMNYDFELWASMDNWDRLISGDL